MNAPQRQQLKGHMEKVHGKAGQFRFGETTLSDVRELLVLQQIALNEDYSHYNYRIAARRDNQQLSYTAYNILFDDGQIEMSAARGELYDMLNSSDMLLSTLGAKVIGELDQIIKSLSTSDYSYDVESAGKLHEVALYLQGAGYVKLAHALTETLEKYTNLRDSELRYQSSLRETYPEAAKRIIDEQMTII